MATLLFSNNATTTLQGTITSTATAAALASGTGALFPVPAANQGFYGSFQDALTGLITEIVLVTAMSGDSITTMVRGQDNTVARAWAANDVFSLFVVAGNLNAMGQKAQIQGQSLISAVDSGAANAYAVALSPAPTLALFSKVIASIGNSNTGAATLAVNGGTATPIWGKNGAVLQGGELTAGAIAEFIYHPTAGTGSTPVFFLMNLSKGALQVSPAVAAAQAAQFSQVVGLVGDSRNLFGYLSAASTSLNLAADNFIVKTALNGLAYCVGSITGTLNLASVGVVNGVAATPTTTGYLMIYGILNPTTGVSGWYGIIAPTSANAPEVAASFPAGFVASGLAAVWPLNSSGQLIFGRASYRTFRTTWAQIYSNVNGAPTTPASFSVSGFVPYTAKSLLGSVGGTCTASASLSFFCCSDVNKISGALDSSVGTGSGSSCEVDFVTPQTLFYTSTGNTGAYTFVLGFNGYRF